MSASISVEDQEIADTLAYIRDAGGFPPDSASLDILRYCVLSTAEAMKRWIAAREGMEGGAVH